MKNKKRNRVFIITGDFHQGKTTFAKNTCDLLQDKGSLVSGFLSEGIFINGERHSFNLRNIKTGETMGLCSVDEIQGWRKFRKYYFNPEAISMGNQILLNATANQITIIDEIGPLELMGEGWSIGLQFICEKMDFIQIWVVRQILVGEIADKFHIPEKNIFDINKHQAIDLVMEIENINSDISTKQ